MTRFEMELSGKLGDFWKRNAEQKIANMQKQADNGEILLDGNCAAYWERSGHYLPSDCVEILSRCVFFFDAEATLKAEQEETDQTETEQTETEEAETEQTESDQAEAGQQETEETEEGE